MSDNNQPHDFYERLQEYLNGQGLYAPVTTAFLPDGDAITIILMPSREVEKYFDGSMRIDFMFQVMTKHVDQLKAYNELVSISNILNGAPDIHSKNGSYIFEDCETKGYPSGVGMSEDGLRYIFAAQFSAKLFIN